MKPNGGRIQIRKKLLLYTISIVLSAVRYVEIYLGALHAHNTGKRSVFYSPVAGWVHVESTARTSDSLFHRCTLTCARKVMCALENAGFRTSGMHKEPLALKTDAPDAAVWDILRCWVRDNPQPPPVRSAGRAILARGPQMISNATFVMAQTGADGSKRQGNGGFLHTRNPQQGWGPLARGSVMAVVADAPGKIANKDKEEETRKVITGH